jgi:mannose-1-phosphate guanylyltransferase
MDAYAIVLAGGRGERFWPLSQPEYPKPFLKLIKEDKTLFQETIQRLEPLFTYNKILIVLTKQHLEIAKNQLPNFPFQNYIIEPVGRDTAASIGLASLYLDKDKVMVVIPADHYIQDTQKFIETLKLGIKLAYEKNCVITLGIEPKRPETGYGYIKIAPETKSYNNKVFTVEKFVEKPDLAKAKEYIRQGTYYWNSGMFIFRNQLIQDLIKRFMPKHWQILSSISKEKDNKVVEEEFSKLERISIDFGVLEKVASLKNNNKVLMIKVDFGWDDIGTWTALFRIKEKDQAGNIIVGKSINIDTKDSIIYAKDSLIASLGVRDLIIVQVKDKILVCSKDYADKLKKLTHLIS